MWKLKNLKAQICMLIWTFGLNFCSQTLPYFSTILIFVEAKEGMMHTRSFLAALTVKIDGFIFFDRQDYGFCFHVEAEEAQCTLLFGWKFSLIFIIKFEGICLAFMQISSSFWLRRVEAKEPQNIIKSLRILFRFSRICHLEYEWTRLFAWTFPAIFTVKLEGICVKFWCNFTVKVEEFFGSILLIMEKNSRI